MDDFFEHKIETPKDPRIHSVTEITRAVREILELEIGQVWVEGEICNHRRQTSGHQYFTLKDERCQLPCVLFSRPGMQLRQPVLENGMCVQARGTLTVYEARGQYQLNVNLVQPAGAGLLQAKFEALKRKLQAEGLFDPERKQPLPRFPQTIAIVTSPTGAAIRDMLNVLQRRASWVRVLICPVRVQGEGAGNELAAAVTELNQCSGNQLPVIDLITVARGGGSTEDLWAFNEEVLARAIFASKIPVVSAVGHEIDFTIADFVADLRAPTPSAAAELIVPDMVELDRRFAHLANALKRQMLGLIENSKHRLDVFISLFREPKQQIAERLLRIDSAEESLEQAVASRFQDLKTQLLQMQNSLREHRPDQVLQLKRSELTRLRAVLQEKLQNQIRTRSNDLMKFDALLRLLSPNATLSRGYSITLNSKGEIIQSVGQVRSHNKLRIKFHDGEIRATAT